MKVEGATTKREKLQYARVLVEVKLGQELPGQISFLIENNKEKEIGVVYEWKPVECSVCKKLGHSTAECNKPKHQKEWRVKMSVKPVVERPAEQGGVEQSMTFQIVTQKARSSGEIDIYVTVQNSFSALEMFEEQVMVGTVACN